ncbi:DUF6378 domain-containing protein [Agrobacterium pusense]|uniref:DUF6378 domain-containing protein n=1 Tax=Agrobacterium pusense TaxID=648995 RepID=UPI00384E7FCF
MSMAVKIEARKSYRARNDEIFGKARRHTGDLWLLETAEGGTCLFYSNGLVYNRGTDEVHAFDLVEELPSGAPTVLPPVRVAILHEGAELTNGSRDAEYGPPSLNMAAAGELKQVFRKHLNRNITPGELEAVELALTKLGRIATGAKPKRDTYVDCATYIAIAGEIALAQLDGLS